jgi:chemotaxis protein methyltransferase CheR
MFNANVSASDAAFVRELVRRRSAISLDESKHYLIETRLIDVAREAGFDSIADLLAAVRRSAGTMDVKIVEALTTHETSFFRDAAPFEALKNAVLPTLARTRSATRMLTIWCAACSSGQEPYTIAMMLNEHFPELAGWPVRIIGTDISESILAKARTGTFRQLEVNRGLPASYLTKYFHRSGLDWQVAPHIRSMVEFRNLNLLDPFGSLRPDIVFMRNVLIYFENATKKNILERVRSILAKDGVLFLGSAETTMGVDEAWERVSYERTVYFKVKP